MVDIYSVCEVRYKASSFYIRELFIWYWSCIRYKFLGFRIAFDTRGSFSFWDGSEFGRKVAVFVAEMSSPVRIHNKRKDVLITGKCLTDGLDNTKHGLDNTTD